MRVPVLLAFAIAASHAAAQGYGRVEYVAPDGQSRAVIIPVHLVDGEFHEHRIEFHDKAGKIVHRSDYSSSDHEHGRCILHAAWSPDSQFFAFSTTSSGGHSAWHFSTFVYHRARNAVFYLDDLVGGPVVEPYFSFVRPARFSSKRLNYEDGKQTADEPIAVQVNLHEIVFPKEPNQAMQRTPR